jgi:hypothetical protein
MIGGAQRALARLNRCWMSVLQYPFPAVHTSLPEDIAAKEGKDKIKWVKFIKLNELKAIDNLAQEKL